VRERHRAGAAVVAWPEADSSPLERTGVPFRAARDVLGPGGLAAADAAARAWARAWGRRPLSDGKGFRELVEWRGSSLLWCAEGFVRTSTAGPRCARTAEIALRLLEATGAVEVDAFGLAASDALLLARASMVRGVLFHGPVPASGSPLPVARANAPRRGLVGVLSDALAPTLAPAPPTLGAGSGRSGPPIVALVDTSETRTALATLLTAVSEELWRPVACVTLDELSRWETRRARRAAAEAEVLLRDRLDRLRGSAGLASSYSHRGVSFADLAAGDLEALLLGHLKATVLRIESAVELVGAAGTPAVLVAVPRRDERRALLLAAAAAGAEAVVVSVGAPATAEPERADGGPRPLAALDWEPGADPAPVTARLREASRGRVERE
jgi:hypothetical protein